MNRQPPDTPDAFNDGSYGNYIAQYCDGLGKPMHEPPVCHINDRMYTRLQWLIYGGVGVLVAGVVLAIYRMTR